MKIKGSLTCIDRLKQTLTEKNLNESEHLSHETKLLMNQALCNLAKTNYKNLDDFKKDLKNICSQVGNLK